MCYPVKLIPTTRNKLRFDIVEFVGIGKFFITRRFDVQLEDLRNSIGRLKSSAFSPREIPNMSFNILGGHFLPKHNRYRITRKGQEEWNGENINFLLHIRDIKRMKNFNSVFFPVEKLHNQEVPFSSPIDPNLTKRLEQAGLPLTKENGKYQHEGKVLIKHIPTKLNYWHCQLTIVDFFGTAIKDTNNTARKSVAHYIINDLLCFYGSVDVSMEDLIPKDVYMKSRE